MMLMAQVNWACAGSADTSHVTFKKLEPESQHGTVFSTAIQLVATYHYNKLKINDDFSSRAFDNYLKHLDPSRVYFFESDIKQFEKYRHQIDEAVFTGNVNLAFEMFNVYQQRLQERTNDALALLKDSSAFNFTEKDSFNIDRENEPWISSKEAMDKLWKQKLKYECMLVKVTGKSFAVCAETVGKRYENLLKFSGKTKSEDVFQLFANAVTELADPHTNYFSPRSSEDFNMSMSLSLEGIGATLQTENEYTKVREVIKGGPADKSKKIMAGDKIIGVGQGKDSDIVNVIDWRIDDVVALIRGKKGTLVRLEIMPVNEPNKTKIIELVRDKIVLEDQSAKSSVKEITRNGKTYKLGVVSIPTFYIDFAAAQRGDPNYKSTTRDVKKLIADLKKQKINGLMIDLRNNGGGSLQEAVELTGLFIGQGPVVQVKNTDGSIKSEYDFDNEVFYDGPVTVLVNRLSASASEIFAAAMQDYGRAIVVGEDTYGKGTVQNMIDLDNFIKLDNGKKPGQVKLTIAKFYRINGSSTQHKGVTPDIVFPGVLDGHKYGEDASPFALPWDQVNATSYLSNDLSKLKYTLLQKHDARMKTNPEYGYLLEDVAIFKKADERKYMTLNIDEYKKESDDAEAHKKQREEERKSRKENAAPDLILDESAQIMADMLDTAKK